MTTKTIVNLQTGETTIVELTTEELAARQPRTPTQQEQKINRAAAYVEEADPLFFKSQRGEATTEEWTSKVSEIKARFPYPGGEG